MLRLLADELPTHWSLPLVWPILASFVAVYLYAKALGVEKYEGPPKWKPLWLVAPIAGLLYGLFIASRMLEPVYRSFASGNGMKMVLAHILAPLLPLITIVAVLIYDRMTRQARA